MKVSDLELSSIFFSMEHPFEIGENGAIKGKLGFQIIVYETTDGGIGIDIEHVDTMDVKFLGIDIELGYQEFKQFKAKLLELGIDVKKLLDEEVDKFTAEFNGNEIIKTKLKQMFNSIK